MAATSTETDVDYRIPQMHRIPAADNIDTSKVVGEIAIGSFNLLAQCLVRREIFFYASKSALKWKTRRKAIALQVEGLTQHADILCFQEMDQFEFYQSLFESLGYGCEYTQKTNGLHGICIAYNKDVYEVESFEKIDFDTVVGDDASELTLEEVRNGNVGQVALLRHKETGQGVVVSNCHNFWNWKYRYVRLLQTKMLIAAAAQLASENKCPYVACGDMNDCPDTIVYKLMTTERPYPFRVPPQLFVTPPDHYDPTINHVFNNNITQDYAASKGLSSSECVIPLTPPGAASATAEGNAFTATTPTTTTTTATTDTDTPTEVSVTPATPLATPTSPSGGGGDGGERGISVILPADCDESEVDPASVPVPVASPVREYPRTPDGLDVRPEAVAFVIEGESEPKTNPEPQQIVPESHQRERMAAIPQILAEYESLPQLESTYNAFDSVFDLKDYTRPIDKLFWTGEPPYTAIGGKWFGTLDFIMIARPREEVSPVRLEAVELMAIPPRRVIEAQTALPNDLYGSDHVPILTKMVFVSRE